MHRTRRQFWKLLIGGCVAAAGTVVLLVSCATTYQPLGNGGGYSDYRLSPTQYYVYFVANANTSQDTAYKFFLTRAAQIAIEKGYSGFYVFKLQNSSVTRTYVTPGSTRTYLYRDVVPEYYGIGGVGFLNTRVYEHAVTVYNPPQYYRISEPGFRGQILLANEQIKGQPPPFNAKMIYDEGMALKHQIDAGNQRTALAAGIGTVIVIGVAAAAAALTPGVVYVP